MAKKKRKKIEYVSNEDINQASMDIYGYITSTKRVKKGYNCAKIEKRVDEIKRFI